MLQENPASKPHFAPTRQVITFECCVAFVRCYLRTIYSRKEIQQAVELKQIMRKPAAAASTLSLFSMFLTWCNKIAGLLSTSSVTCPASWGHVMHDMSPKDATFRQSVCL